MNTQKVNKLRECLDYYKSSNIVLIELKDSLGRKHGISNHEAIGIAMNALIDELKRQIEEEERKGATGNRTAANGKFVFTISSSINGERFADMTPQRMCEVVKELGKQVGDILVTDDSGVVCSYDKESGSAIHVRPIQGGVFTMPGNK